MLRLVLPSRPRRPELLSFSLALGLTLGAVVLLLVPVVGLGTAVVGAAITFAMIATTGAARPSAVVPLYRHWNRTGRRVAALAEAWVLRVVYYVVLPSVGLAGSKLVREKQDEAISAWVPRPGLELFTFTSLSAEPDGPTANLGWVRGLLGWTRSSANLWVFAMLPFLVLLRSFSYKRGEVRVETNYTLY